MFLKDINDNIITNNDLQNKGEWCKHGLSKEFVFVEKYGDLLNIKMNPEKEFDKYCPDLKYKNANKLCDLKTQNTPFFTSDRYGISSQFAVTFNRKDRLRYQEKYPDIDVFFWVEWIAVKGVYVIPGRRDFMTKEVQPMTGIWKIAFSDLDVMCESSPLHSYEQRVDDTNGNAKESYVLDLNNPKFFKVV